MQSSIGRKDTIHVICTSEHLLADTVGGSDDVAVIDEAAAAVQFTAVGEGDQPRVLVARGWLPAHYSAAAVGSTAFCPQTRRINYLSLVDYWCRRDCVIIHGYIPLLI